jgi:hypothetical protein
VTRIEDLSRRIIPITAATPTPFNEGSKHFSGCRNHRVECQERSGHITIGTSWSHSHFDLPTRGTIGALCDHHYEENTMQMTTVGLFAGLLLGLALVLGNFGDMLIVALFGAIGVVVCKVVEGELDLSQLTNRQRRQ